MMGERILERDLQLPALYLIKMKNGRITTSELSSLLRDILKPSGEDLEILSDRADDKFSQIVRNLTAKERSFVKNGYIERESKTNSPLYITPKGATYLENNIELVEYLFINDFDFDDVIKPLKIINTTKKKLEVFDENVIISEGLKRVVNVTVYERSKKLRDFAIDFFTLDGKIDSSYCTFNFEDFYGPEIGKGFIEIHHTKPIFKYTDEDIQNTLQEAVKNLTPVCSNCHRIIHRTENKSLEIQTLIASIHTYGKYGRK